MIKRNILLLVFSIFVFSLLSQSITITGKDLKTLAGMMSGRFNSEKQAAGDSTFLNISLVMTPVMTSHPDGSWLYVEQAMASALDKPYRQRVYHLYIYDDSTIVSKVFELKNPQQYVGSANDPVRLAPVSADSIIERQGCSIFLKKTGKKEFAGSTPGKECLSSLRGATYATSEVIILPKKMISWDRGWDREDKQVWGAEKGGYIFLKQ